MDGVEKWESAGWDADFEQTAKEKKSIRRRVIDDDAMEIATEEILELDAANIRRLCPEPKPGQRYVIVTEKSMNAVSFIKATLDKGGIDEMWMAIYRINDKAVKIITDLIEQGKIRKAHFVLSNFFRESKKPERWMDSICRRADDLGYDFVFTHTHTKVTCIRRGGDFFVFEGSGNISDNARIEVYNYENNRIVYDFHVRWMRRVFESKGKGGGAWS